MKWYTDAIKESIGAIFVVVITELFNAGVLGQRFQTNNFVAIEIKSGSLPHQQFSEFYKEPSDPSVYFIGKDWSPLDIIIGNDE